MSKVPRWLELQAEIDMRYWMLEKMLADSKKQLPIEKMVDQATGYDQERIRQAQQIMDEISILKAEYYKAKPKGEQS